MTFTIFAPDSLLRFYMFASYLRIADLCKSVFCLVGAEKLPHRKLHLKKIPVYIYFNYVMLFRKMYELDEH